MRRELLALALACAAGAASAQLADDPDWKETEAPPPPALRTTGLVPLDVRGTSLRFGIDPDSIVIGTDRVVRYVVVATSTSGTVNAMYEGLRCGTGEVKVYARHNPGSGWVPARNAEWTALSAGQAATRHSLVAARSGVCMEAAPNRSRDQIVRDLRSDTDRRFRNN